MYISCFILPNDLERVHPHWSYTHPSDKWTNVMAMMLVVEVYWSPCPSLQSFHPQTSISKTFLTKNLSSSVLHLHLQNQSIPHETSTKKNTTFYPPRPQKSSPAPLGAFNRSNRSSSSSGSPWKAPNASLSSFPSTSRVRRRESCRTGEGTSRETGFVAGKTLGVFVESWVDEKSIKTTSRLGNFVGEHALPIRTYSSWVLSLKGNRKIDLANWPFELQKKESPRANPLPTINDTYSMGSFQKYMAWRFIYRVCKKQSSSFGMQNQNVCGPATGAVTNIPPPNVFVTSGILSLFHPWLSLRNHDVGVENGISNTKIHQITMMSCHSKHVSEISNQPTTWDQTKVPHEVFQVGHLHKEKDPSKVLSHFGPHKWVQTDSEGIAAKHASSNG